MKRTILTAIVLGSAFSAVTSFAAETKSGSGGANAWSVKAPLPRTNSEFGVAELDGKIYVMGGYPADRKSVAEVQVYDSKTDKWQIIAPLPQALNHIMPAAVNGKIYVIGGQTTESSEPDKAGFVNTVYEYDPTTGKWTVERRCRRCAAAALLRLPTAKSMSPVVARRAVMISPFMTRKRTSGRRCLIYRLREIISQPALMTARSMSLAGVSKAAFAARPPMR